MRVWMRYSMSVRVSEEGYFDCFQSLWFCIELLQAFPRCFVWVKVFILLGQIPKSRIVASCVRGVSDVTATSRCSRVAVPSCLFPPTACEGSGPSTSSPTLWCQFVFVWLLWWSCCAAAFAFLKWRVMLSILSGTDLWPRISFREVTAAAPTFSYCVRVDVSQGPCRR